MLALIGCGDNSRECGLGTELVNGICRGAQCGVGTITDDQGRCVPDGSIVCTDGTTFNPDAGVCVADITACGPDLVIFEGECRDAADIDADYYETAEPNDGMNGTPSAVDIAPEGEAITIQGCVAPSGNMPDGDTYVITAAGPTLLDVMVDGYNGLSGAFMMESSVMMLNQNEWIRFGLNLFNDTSHRQVFLPAAGEYWLTVTDGRSILDGTPAGDGNTCYLTTITTLPMPTPTPAAGLIVGGLNGEASFYEYIAVEGDIVFVDARSDNDTVLIDAVLMANNQYFESSSGDFDTRPLGSPATSGISGLAAGDQVVVVVDPVIDYGIDTAQYELRMNSANPQPLPGDGSTTTVVDNDQEVRYLYFDVDAGDVVHIRFATDAPGGVIAEIVDPDLNVIASVCNGCAAYDNYVYFTETARYYLALTDLSVPAPPSFQLTGERIHHTPSALAVGTNLTGEGLNTDGSTFYTLDFNAIDWVAFSGQATADFIGDLELLWYPRTRAGQLGIELGQFDGFLVDEPLPPPPAEPTLGRIYDPGSTFLIRARDNGFLVGDPGTFDMAITQRPFTHLGVIDGINPVELIGAPIGTGELQRYIVEAPVFSDATVSVGGLNFDAVVTEYDRFESETLHDAGLVDDNEVFDVKVVPSAFIALGVRESFGDPGSYDIIINGDLPPMQVSAGNLPFLTVCPSEGGSGEELGLTSGSTLPPDDEGFTDVYSFSEVGMPDFNFLGIDAAVWTISSNGFLTFDPTGTPYDSFNIPPIPDPALPNGYIAPLWADLEGTRICVASDGITLTIQFDGFAWFVGTPAHFQLRLHDDNSMDFIYAENHVLSSASASIGLENLPGDGGFQMGFGSTDELAAPGTSWTLTPNPMP